MSTPVEEIRANSYVGFDTITQQIEHKLLKRGFQFNVIVVGEYSFCPVRRCVRLYHVGGTSCTYTRMVYEKGMLRPSVREHGADCCFPVLYNANSQRARLQVRPVLESRRSSTPSLRHTSLTPRVAGRPTSPCARPPRFRPRPMVRDGDSVGTR